MRAAAVKASVRRKSPRPRAPAGAVLRASGGPVGDAEFPLGFGRHAIGRSPDADIRILFDGVSLRHAEIDLRPEGAFLSNLVSPSETQVNGRPAHTIRLHPGDQILIGPILLEYRELSAESFRRVSRWWRLLLPVALAGAIVWLILGLI
jgi:hypothetical protein